MTGLHEEEDAVFPHNQTSVFPGPVFSICTGWFHGTSAFGSGKRHWPRAVSNQWALLGIGQFGEHMLLQLCASACHFVRKCWHPRPSRINKESLLTCLANLFHSTATQKKVGIIPPKKFISRLRKENDLFDNYMRQDACEFLNYFLNTIAHIIGREETRKAKWKV